MTQQINRHLAVTVTGKDGSSTEHATLRDDPIDVIERSIDDLIDLAKRRSDPIGYCIYCGSTEALTREHIVPFGLSGEAVLPKASCRKCARITGRFEEDVLRGPMRTVRILKRLRSRTKHTGAPQTARLTVLRGEIEEEVELPLDQYPVMLHFPVLAPLAPFEQRVKGLTVTGVHAVLFGPRPEDVLRTFDGVTGIRFSSPDDWTPFARLIAKIAYATAAASGALARLDGPAYVLRGILEDPDDLGRWIGTPDGPICKYPGSLHRIDLAEHPEGWLLARVQLFSDGETPAYDVLLGRLKTPPAVDDAPIGGN